MTRAGSRPPPAAPGLSGIRDEVRRSFAEFLSLPTCIIAGFLLLAVGTYLLDRAGLARLDPARELLKGHVFGNPQATSDLLGTVATSIITVTSITFSLLLLAVQQSAAAMTSQVFAQFLRRRSNQVYFGFFVGLALYTLVTLATVNPPFNPVYGATLAVLLTAVALCLLLVLIYGTINQMRPIEIVEAIHDHTLAARQRQLPLLARTRRAARRTGGVRTPVRSIARGFVTRLDVDAMAAAARDAGGSVEVVLRVSVGSYTAFGDVIAEIVAETGVEGDAVAKAVLRGVRLARQRDPDADPAYGIEQLLTIAWTSISTAKSNPYPGLLIVYSLRDLLAHWSANDEVEGEDESPTPVVYIDHLFDLLLGGFESLAVVSSESMQHQTFAEIVCTFAIMFGRLPPARQPRAEDVVVRILSALGDHVLTADLDAALDALTRTLAAAGRAATAAAVERAHGELRASVGTLNSRGTRVPGARD